MNDDRRKIIKDSQGQIYHYDPERDIYYRPPDLSLWDRFGWLAVITLLGCLCYTLSLTVPH
jgi:hypothetical protein